MSKYIFYWVKKKTCFGSVFRYRRRYVTKTNEIKFERGEEVIEMSIYSAFHIFTFLWFHSSGAGMSPTQITFVPHQRHYDVVVGRIVSHCFQPCLNFSKRLSCFQKKSKINERISTKCSFVKFVNRRENKV